MPARTALNVSVTTRQRKLVDRLVESGRYASASDVVGAAMRLLEDEELDFRGAVEGIQRGLDAVARGETVPLAEFRRRFEREHGSPQVKYRVEVADPARTDADLCFEFIAARSPEQARLWYAQLMRRIGRLDTFPERCPLAAEARAFDRPIRQLTIGWYRVLFVVEGRVVQVLHIRHGARRRLGSAELE